MHDEIRYRWPEAHVDFTFTRLHETDSGAVRGMVSVDWSERTNGHGPGHIFWSTVTLTSNTDRKTLVGKLDKAAPRADGWEQDVDRCFQDTWERHTRVPEPIVLADVLDVPDEAEFLYDRVLPMGQIALLLADQGSTKSFLMLYLSLCTVLGIESVFGPPRRCGAAVFFDWEVDERVARRRLTWIARGLGVDIPRDLFYVNMSTRGRIFDRIRDMRYMIDRINPSLCVIDSLTFATGGDLNSAEYAAPTMSAIGSLGEGVTKLVSAHPSKGSRNASADEISVTGSALFEFRARAIWHMKREQQRSSRFGVSMTVRKPFDGAPPSALAYRMVFDNATQSARFERMTLDDSPMLEASTLTLAERIRKLLAKKGRLDTNELAELAGFDAATVRTECNRMPDVFPLASGGGRGKVTVWVLGTPGSKPKLATD